MGSRNRLARILGCPVTNSSLSFSPARTSAAAASLARDRLTMSERAPLGGSRKRHIPGCVSSGSICTIGARTPCRKSWWPLQLKQCRPQVFMATPGGAHRSPWAQPACGWEARPPCSPPRQSSCSGGNIGQASGFASASAVRSLRSSSSNAPFKSSTSKTRCSRISPNPLYAGLAGAGGRWRGVKQRIPPPQRD